MVKVANPYFTLRVSDGLRNFPPNYLQDAVRYAVKNKVFPLFYERCLRYGIHLPKEADILMREYERRRKAQLDAVKLLQDIREKYGIELMFFKTFKPFNYIPDDIDILLQDEKDLNLLISILKSKGYFMLKIGTPEVVLRKVENSTYVDLDIHTRLAVGHLELFKSENLWRGDAHEIIEIEGGYKIPKLSENYEIVREAAYSLLKDFSLSVVGLYLAIDAMMKRDLKAVEEIAMRENMLPHLYLYLDVAYALVRRMFRSESGSKLRYNRRDVSELPIPSRFCEADRVPYPYPLLVIAWAYMSKAWLELSRSRNLKVILQILKQPSSRGIGILLDYLRTWFRGVNI